MFFRQSAANLLRRFRLSTISATSFPRKSRSHCLVGGQTTVSGHEFEWHHSRTKQYGEAFQWIFLSGQAAIIIGANVTPTLAEEVSIELMTENNPNEASLTGLQKIEDGSIVSNEHTSKWRIFTDHGRDLFLQGKLEEAEKLFLAALKEAKEGFGERDAHVASACNNLAELYRVKKAFDKADPLYLEAIRILGESYGPDDVRVGAALHNLGQFYLVQSKLEPARVSYERALKIKRRVLGEGHPDYADTMYHLGHVVYLQGNANDSEALVQDSVRILEEGGLGTSIACLKRMQFLAQLYAKSNRIADAENIQRRILHIIELSKGWDSLDTVIAAERLALTLQSAGNLKEAEEFFERCLAARKTLLPENHIQIAANMVNIAIVKKNKFDQLRKRDIYQAMAELETAKALFSNSIRVSRQVLVQSSKQKGMQQPGALSSRIGKDRDLAMTIVLQSYYNLAWLETAKMEIQEAGDYLLIDNILRECMSTYKEYETLKPLPDSTEVKAQYLLCMKNLSEILSKKPEGVVGEPTEVSSNELADEIKRVEAELSRVRRRR